MTESAGTSGGADVGEEVRGAAVAIGGAEGWAGRLAMSEADWASMPVLIRLRGEAVCEEVVMEELFWRLSSLTEYGGGGSSVN